MLRAPDESRLRRARMGSVRHGVLCGAALTLQVACTAASPRVPEGAIAVGALLPFTGTEAAIGASLEQAMLLAAEDINAAGGVGGQPLAILSRDSNSGSQRGFNQLLELLYTDQVSYFVGPEENDLASQIVSDVKALDLLQILPGYTAPLIKRTSSRGAWLRLAPSDATIGCGMARLAMREKVKSANALVALDDYSTSLAASFNAEFAHLGGTPLPSITIDAGQASYAQQIAKVFSYGADETLLIAYPATASKVVTEWNIGQSGGSWSLAPMLEEKVFLLNVPFGALEGYSGLAPSLSLASECQPDASGQDGDLVCVHDNADRFVEHFTRRWQSPPFPAAHFYYDAVVLLAMGLRYGLATIGQLPTTARLQKLIRDLNVAGSDVGRWDDLPTLMARLDAGTKVRYVGAAAQYDFDPYGAAQHTILDRWTITDGNFDDMGSISADCPIFQ